MLYTAIQYNDDRVSTDYYHPGVLNIRTECGCVRVEPCEIIVIPRGIKFSVDLETDGPSRGYVLEVRALIPSYTTPSAARVLYYSVL